MKILDLDYIVNIRMELTAKQLNHIVEMCSMVVEEYDLDVEKKDYEEVLRHLEQVKATIQDFETDSKILYGHW
jgi:hypothetical protein